MSHEYGHCCRDQALKHQAGRLKEKLRAEDLTIRCSVEDFMLPLAIPLKMNAV
ncbi:diguanylate cyclase [Acinetobacter johnsonii]|nr:diguanylate cyclase [Acinetobacter johnsonii]